MKKEIKELNPKVVGIGYVEYFPCPNCKKTIIRSDIKTVKILKKWKSPKKN